MKSRSRLPWSWAQTLGDDRERSDRTHGDSPSSPAIGDDARSRRRKGVMDRGDGPITFAHFSRRLTMETKGATAREDEVLGARGAHRNAPAAQPDQGRDRAAAVQLKEGRRLVVCPRETPLSVIHLENLLRIKRAGAAVVPAMPGFYHLPESITDLIDFVAGRLLDAAGLDASLVRPWGE